jgi:hypothetical protein
LWLPKFHPLDTFRFAGLDFTTTLAWTHYQTYKTGLKAAAPGNEYPTYRGFANRYMANFLPNGSDASTIKQTVFADQAVGRPNTPLASAPSYAPPAVWGLTGEGINNWFITRGWELNHQPLNGNSGLEGFLGRTYTDIDVDNSGSYPILSARCPTCAPYVFYGWYAAAAFDTGPHKSGPGASPAYRDNPWGQISGHSHTTLSEKWYKLQLLINNGNRILTGEFTEDCPYLYAYSNQMSEMRPSAWLSWENNAMIPQATWGAVSSATDVSQGNSINDTYISTDDPFNQQLWNNFVTQGDVQAQMGRVASQYQEFIARFTNNSGTAARFPCVGGPTPKFVYTHSISTFCSVVALALEVFSYYNNGCNATGNGCVAGSPTNAQITAIVGWADAVWPGNNFSQYSTMGNTCAFTTSVPPNLKCANWN